MKNVFYSNFLVDHVLSLNEIILWNVFYYMMTKLIAWFYFEIDQRNKKLKRELINWLIRTN